GCGGMAVIDTQQLHGGPRDDLQRVLRAAVTQEVGALDAEQQIEERGLKRAVLLLEVRERLVVDERDQHEAVAMRGPKRPVDVDEPVDRLFGRPRGQLYDPARCELEDWVKYAF